MCDPSHNAGYIGMIPSGWDSERPIRKIKLQPDVDDLEAELSFELLFQHTTAYPETEPNIKVSNPRGLNNNEVEELLQVLLSEAAEHVGMASVFSVMQAGKEWLDTKAGLVEGAHIWPLSLYMHATVVSVLVSENGIAKAWP